MENKVGALFYDIEVFPYYWCVVVVDEINETRYVFEDIESLRAFYKENRERIWIGYNSRQYDAPMLRFIMLGLDPYECSYDLIVGEKKWFHFPFQVKELYKRIPLLNYDTMYGFNGLKKLEGYMGSSIIETSVPFDTDRPLTREEKDEVVYYCTHDVVQCRKAFYYIEKQLEEFKAHTGLIETFNMHPSFVSKTKAQLSAIILNAKKVNRYDEWEFEFPNTMQVDRYTEVLDWYMNPYNHDYKKKLDIKIAGVPHTFAWGGLHGAVPNYFGEGCFLNMDVGSYYPALMIEYNYLSRNVLDPSKYKEIRDYRLVLKKNKDPRQLPYKIVLNATFGAMKDKFNDLYDPRQANNVCIGGQVLLLDLIEKLEDHCQLIQSNTDGILVKLNSWDELEGIMQITEAWSKRTRMSLEYDKFTRIYQKDVNNYVMVPEGDLYDKKGKPNWKTKGAYVKKQFEIDYDLPIVNEALVNFMVFGKPIEDTIQECRNLIKFQKISMVSSKYKYAVWGEQILNERHLRVFASKDVSHAGVFKLHKERGNLVKIPDTPVRAFLVNEDVTDKTIADYPLDIDYYIGVAYKRLKGFGCG